MTYRLPITAFASWRTCLLETPQSKGGTGKMGLPEQAKASSMQVWGEVWHPSGPGASGLRREDADTEEAKTYAMLMADTVLVKGQGEAPEVLTTVALRSWKDNAYFFKVGPSCPARRLRRMAAV